MKNENKRRAKSVKVIPDGFYSVTPFLIAKGATELMEFMKDAFDARVTSITRGDNGTVIHATAQIGNSNIMIADEMANMSATTGMLYLYVEDIDSVYRNALDAGGTSIREPKDEYYGDRSAGIKDSWGNHWWIATHIEDVSNEEIKARMESLSIQTVDS